MNTPSTTDNPRRWVQFGLRTLLFIVLCICGILAGYRVGLYQGIETRRRQLSYAKTYQVADLLDEVTTPNGVVESYNTLIDVITSTIEPDSWDEVGGPGSIKEFPASKSLVIYQSGQNHDRIETLLAELRQNKKLADAWGLPDRQRGTAVNSEFRTWTDVTGALKFEAEFLEATGGEVKLKLKKDGEILQVPIDKLSKEDQEFIKTR